MSLILSIYPSTSLVVSGKVTLTDKNESLFFLEDDFTMYLSIAKYASNALPYKVLQNYIFQEYKVKKKFFPKRLFYKMN